MNPAAAQALAACLVLAAIAASAVLRPVRSVAPPAPLACASAEPWMADCLPGVGAKTRERAAAAVRAGHVAALPARAQAMARDWFLIAPAVQSREADRGR